MMCDISGNDVVDRRPIILSGFGVDQLLEVPKLLSSTGESILQQLLCHSRMGSNVKRKVYVL